MLLLVAVAPDEESTLADAFPDEHRMVSSEDLGTALDDDVAAVVVGTRAASPLATVQQVHRAQPRSGVVLLTTPGTEAELRRSTMYAPDMPVSLKVLDSGSPRLSAEVRETLEASRLHRRAPGDAVRRDGTGDRPDSAQLLRPHRWARCSTTHPSACSSGTSTPGWSPGTAGPATSSHSPTTRRERRSPRSFPSGEYLEAAFALARTGRLGEAGTAPILDGPGDTAVEVSTAPTRLENGDEAVLVLIQDVSARRQAERTRDRLAEHVGLLGRVSEALAGTLDVDMALRRLADQVVPALADWVSLQTYDERGQSSRAVVRHRDRRLEREAATVREGLMAGLGHASPSRRVALSGQPVLVPTVAPEELDDFVADAATREVVRRMGVGSILSVPLPGRDEVRGSLSLVRNADSPPYTEQDLAVGVEVGRRAGVALDTLALYAQQRDIAAGLQRSLLTEPPQNEQTEVVVRYVAAAEEAQVGGDWYDAFLQADGSTVLVIGDVMGHDTRAAAAMGQLRALLRGISYTTGAGPAEMLSRLDEAIEGLRVQTTATGLVVSVAPRAPGDTGPAHLRWSNAGHPPAIVVPPAGGAVALENDEADLLLGVLAHTERTRGPRPSGTGRHAPALHRRADREA